LPGSGFSRCMTTDRLRRVKETGRESSVNH
jgi:hypothetical protein